MTKNILFGLAVLLAFSAAVQAAPGGARKPSPPRTLVLDEPEFSLEYPEGWVANLFNYSPSCRTCGLDLYTGSPWFRAEKHKGSRWAHIHVASLDLRRPPVDLSRCRVPVANLEDYLREMDCGHCDDYPGCPPCKPGNRWPRPPVGNNCGKFLKAADLPLGKGYLYEDPILPMTSPDRAFRATLRHWVLVYDVRGNSNIHRFDFWTTKDRFEEYLPRFLNTVETFRLKPRKTD